MRVSGTMPVRVFVPMSMSRLMTMARAVLMTRALNVAVPVGMIVWMRGHEVRMSLPSADGQQGQRRGDRIAPIGSNSSETSHSSCGSAPGAVDYVVFSVRRIDVLILENLSRSFREGGREHRVLDGVNARIGSGESVAVIGRSGSGKSTLLNVVSGIDRLDAGSVQIDGRDVSSLPEPERTRFRRKHIGFIYQFFNLVPTLNAEENVRLVLELNGVRAAEARRRSAAMLAQVGLGDRLHSAVDAFSGGEQQRVAIARALVHEPQLLLADEPTGNLDEETARQVFPLVTSLVRQRGATLLLVTHDRALTAGADRVLEMRDGRLTDTGALAPS
jgi:putative ABC transport system ATP-binding protein